MVAINEIKCWQFRNYAELTWEAPAEVNLLIGPNGVGKTNILEAIYFLSHGRSHRTNREQELIRSARGGSIPTDAESGDDLFLGQGSKVSLQLDNGHSIEARFLPREGSSRWQTQFLRDGQGCRSRSEVLGLLPTLSFSLSDLEILRGSPEDRRRWLDLATAQLIPGHVAHLQRWKQVVSQKRALLKQVDFPTPSANDSGLLDVLNQQLAVEAYPILKNRLHTLAAIAAETPALYTRMSEGAEGTPRLHYQTHYWQEMPAPEETSPEAWQAACLENLASIQANEIRRQSVLWGVHRDEIKMLFQPAQQVQEVDATAYASQGQQRSYVIALKLAELAVLRQRLETSPVILLDDVMAELDGGRQARLLEIFPEGVQVFLTMPEQASLAGLNAQFAALGRPVQYWRIAETRVTQKENP